MGAEERGATLKRFSESGELDVRGVAISEALFGEIADAAPHDADGHLAFSAARFGGATFEGDAEFSEATFKGEALFGEVTFKGEALFGEATFEGTTWFDNVTFEGDAWFAGTTFKGEAWFGETTFEGDAEFSEATFKVAWFNKMTFEGDAEFSEATFKVAWFEKVTFKGTAGFDNVTFEGDAWFAGTMFKGTAGFGGATFEGDALFGEATFQGYAGFGGATFEGNAEFLKATFNGYAGFGGATFKGAGFGGATFEGDGWFAEATFKDAAVFGEATFKDAAVFGEATFKDNAGFGETTFEGAADFGGATFEGEAWFVGATFMGDVPLLGPIVVGGSLNLDGVQFASPVRIEADASTVTCRRGRFPGGAQFGMRRALVRLDDTDLSAPSLLTGPAVAANDPAGMKLQPRLLSLQRANVAGLGVANVDLADCRFAGAHNLDKLRLEAGTVFGLSPAVAGWERRQVIAEEAAWRAARASARARPGRWKAPRWHAFDDKPKVLSPGAVAVLYRALRKSREDAKDEPGAADFYYGEMEMRRHDRGEGHADGGWSRGLVSRSVLTAYWLVSGYGLRAWRSLAALAAVMAISAGVFRLWGFTHSTSYWKSLLFAFRSTLSLTDAQVNLTAWGGLFQAILRLTGPVLLALTLLALRGRVKR